MQSDDTCQGTPRVFLSVLAHSGYKRKFFSGSSERFWRISAIMRDILT